MTPGDRLRAQNAIADRLQNIYGRHAPRRISGAWDYDEPELDRETAMRMADDLLTEGWRKVEPPV